MKINKNINKISKKFFKIIHIKSRTKLLTTASLLIHLKVFKYQEYNLHRNLLFI